MKKRAQILLGVLVCFMVIGISYYWAVSLMDSMYAYRSPLQYTPPIPGEAIGTPLTRSVVIVLIDALRYDTALKSEVMPHLNQLRSEGAYALMHSRPPSYSQAGYTVLLTGAWPDISDGPVLNLDYADIPTFTQDNLFSAAHRSDKLTAISAYNWFEKLIPQETVAASFYTPGEDQAADRDVTDAAIPWLRQGKYQLVLIHLDQVDYAGHHEGGPVDARWDAAATRVDELLREITSAMDLTKDTLLIVSDHGQIGTGGHGGQDSIVLLEPFILVGKQVIAGNYGDVDMVDVAPTVAALLGTSIPATSQGRPQIQMLDINLAQVDKINQVVAKQQNTLAGVYEKAIGVRVPVQPSENIVTATQEGMDRAREIRLNSERLTHGLFAIVIGMIAINLAAWHAKSYLSWFLVGGVIYLAIFNIKYILIDQKTYSLSSVVDAYDLITSTALTAFIALLISWFVVLLGVKSYQRGSRQAAGITMKFILMLLSILAIPTLIHYGVNGATVTWTLPDFLISFLGLLFLIQTLVVAAIGLILVGFSALIGLIFRK
jgi:hypothetical protein